MNINWVRGTHLCEDLVQPLQWPVQVNFDPARRRGHHLPTILHPPPLHEADSYGAHPSQLEHLLKTLVHRLRQLLGEKLVVEHAHDATGRDLADSRRMPVVSEVRVHTLDKDTALRQTLCVDLSSDVEKTNASSDVSPCLFDDAVPVDVGEETETEPVG